MDAVNEGPFDACLFTSVATDSAFEGDGEAEITSAVDGESGDVLEAPDVDGRSLIELDAEGSLISAVIER